MNKLMPESPTIEYISFITTTSTTHVVFRGLHIDVAESVRRNKASQSVTTREGEKCTVRSRSVSVKRQSCTPFPFISLFRLLLNVHLPPLQHRL